MYTIGQASEATRVSAKAIRHYEALALIPPVMRRGSYRHYDATHLHAIKLIRQAQLLGFTLAELRALGKEDCTPDWPRFAQAIVLKRESLQREMATLQQRDDALAELEKTLPALVGQLEHCEDLATHLLKT